MDPLVGLFAVRDPLDLISLARALIDIDSTSGKEGEVGTWLSAYLCGRGYNVVEQPVDGDRFNLLATVAAPVVVFSTHIDCVPPFIASREENGILYGRGSCDAKGILAAQLTAADRLRLAGEGRIGLLFVVGEERGSDGARAANTRATTSRYLIDGEPTDNRLGVATRGVLRVRLKATGRAAHSSYPELGVSAIEKLVDALIALRGLVLPDDPLLGRTHYSVGIIAGGVAPNVIPAVAEAEVLFRTIADGGELRAALNALTRWVHIEDVLEVPPVKMESVPGFETAVFPYTTDIPLLDRWGQPFLFGPGSVLVAHTDDERVQTADLYRAVDDYVRLAEALLRRHSPECL